MKFSKTIRQLICPLLAALIFCSCGTVTTVQTTNTSESTRTAESENTTQEGVQETDHSSTATETEAFTDGVGWYPRESIQDINILTVRWGDAIPESRYEYYWGGGKDENGNTVPLLTGMTAVKVEVLKVWNQAEYITRNNGHTPTFSFSEITYLWVDDGTLSEIQTGSIAIVFPYAHNPKIQQNYDFTPFYQYLFMDGSQDYSVILHDTVGKPVKGNVFPIVDGKIQITKSDSVSWSMQVNSFLRYNELLDSEQSATPRFRDGMTLEEFDQMIDLITQYVKR